uniref:Cyclin-dependent kinase inhibitor 1B n=1 Tax=Nothobranchius korthausae TaxID=1143690 RepID=A0A1A8FYT2_9TELE
MCNKMSDVRLSNASPTVERVDARQPENVRSVCRALFGTPDREETRRYAASLQQESRLDFMERYNFDPVADRPLSPGNYEWEEDGDAPEFYRRPPHGSQRPRAEADSPGENHRGSGEEDRRRTESAQGSNGSRKRRSDTAASYSEECSTKRSNSDREEDEDGGCEGSQSVSVSRPEDKEAVPLKPVPEH